MFSKSEQLQSEFTKFQLFADSCAIEGTFIDRYHNQAMLTSCPHTIQNSYDDSWDVGYRDDTSRTFWPKTFRPHAIRPGTFFPKFLRPRKFHPWMIHNQQNSANHDSVGHLT